MTQPGAHRLKAVIADWAGTTVDHGSRAPAGVFVEVFRRAGVEISLAEARGPMGMEKKDHIRTVARDPRVAERWRAAHGRSWTEDDIERMYRQFIPLQTESLPKFGDLIPGVREAAGRWRERGLKIGATTGYDREMTKIVVRDAQRQGYQPDDWVCAADVPAGRPAPWMALLCAMHLGVYPIHAIVKIGDTTPDIDEGRNAGMWTIAVARTGNELGLSAPEVAELAPADLEKRLAPIREKLTKAGAHFVVDSIVDADPVLDEIDRRLSRGERP